MQLNQIVLLLLSYAAMQANSEYAPTMQFKMWGSNYYCYRKDPYSGQYTCTDQQGQQSTVKNTAPAQSSTTQAVVEMSSPKIITSKVYGQTPGTIANSTPKGGRVQCVTYSPYKGTPGSSQCPTPKQVSDDMDAILGISKCVRFYSTDCIGVVQSWLDKSASDNSIKVGLGVWISQDLARNQKEINLAVQTVKKYEGRAQITHLSIGNEVIFRNDLPINQLIGYLQNARAQLGSSKVPIAYQDNAYNLYTGDWVPSMCENVDLVLSNTFAYYLRPYGNQPDTNPQAFVKDAVQLTNDYLAKIQARCPQKKTCHSEIMWPTEAPNQNYPNKASLSISQAFFQAWTKYAAENGACYHWHEAFDATWRADYGDYTYHEHLGIFDAQNKCKYNLM